MTEDEMSLHAEASDAYVYFLRRLLQTSPWRQRLASRSRLVRWFWGTVFEWWAPRMTRERIDRINSGDV